MTLEPDRQARYKREWTRFRRLRAAFWLLLAMLLLVLFFSAAIKGFLHASAGGFIEILLACMALVWVTGYNVSRFPCPRCGRVFARERWFGLISSSSQCNFCKLALWSVPDDIRQPKASVFHE